MEYRRITPNELNYLWPLHIAYKEAIGEDAPGDEDREALIQAMNAEQIRFYGAWDGETLVGCCSVMIGFSTFNYRPSGVFEDFFILPEYRHRGIARELVRYAFQESGVGSMTVGCADCDQAMYEAIGFTTRLGNLMAYDG